MEVREDLLEEERGVLLLLLRDFLPLMGVGERGTLPLPLANRDRTGVPVFVGRGVLGLFTGAGGLEGRFWRGV